MIGTTTPRGDAQKKSLLKNAIIGAIASRGAATLRDGMQAGLTEAEVRLHWDDALADARKSEPRLANMAAQS